MSVNRSTGEADRKLVTLVGLVAVLGLAVAAGAAIVAVTGAAAPAATVAAAALLVVVGTLLDVGVRVRATRHGSSWTDAGILLGLAVLPTAWVIVVTVVSIAAVRIFERVKPMKSAFAVAKESLVALVGGLVIVAAGASPSVQTPASISALALAYVAMTIVDQLLTIPVIALASRTSIVERLRTNLDIRLLMAAGRFAVVVLAVLALQLDPVFLYMLPILVLIGHLWHERWVRAREERRAWQNLAAATEAFTGVDLCTVVPAAVKGAAKLFSADAIEVETWLGLERRLVRGTDAEIIFDGDPEEAPDDGANVYAVALHGYPGRRDIGALRLRFRGDVQMSDREQAMLASYAASLDTAVRNAAAYGQLGEATLAHARAATQDPLTGLANRRELERVLTEALASEASPEHHIALLMIDLKHFKEVNETLGHLTGDQVLRQLAARLANNVSGNDLAARFGGDEFAVILRDVVQAEHARARAKQVLADLTEPVEVDGLPLVVETHTGLALAVDAHDDQASAPFRATSATWMSELMRRADVAMYQAKRTSQTLVCYTPGTDTADRERLALAGQLARAVSQREFVLNFQPIVDLDSGRVVGAEALARWRHPTRGQLEPRWFLDLLERSNHLREFTAAILDEALSAADMWQAAGHDLSVSVNISARSLLDGALPQIVRAALAAHHTPPHRLCLELTETLAISQLEAVDRVLTQLQQAGVQLSLDDFGTGYSSLSALARIPVHQLKVDRSFVQMLREPTATGAEPRDRDWSIDAMAHAKAVIRSTIQLGRTLDLSVVAEGIETAHQRRTLLALGCGYGQGNLFAPALAPDRFLALLTSRATDQPHPAHAPLSRDGKVIRLPARGGRGDDPVDQNDIGTG